MYCFFQLLIGIVTNMDWHFAMWMQSTEDHVEDSIQWQNKQAKKCKWLASIVSVAVCRWEHFLRIYVCASYLTLDFLCKYVTGNYIYFIVSDFAVKTSSTE